MTGAPPPVDTELEALFASDSGLLEFAHSVRAARPEPVLDHRFAQVLRAQLIDAAAAELRPRLSRSLFGLRPRHLVTAFAGLGGVAIAAALAIVLTGHPSDRLQTQPIATSSVTGNAAVNPGDVITVAFNQAMDHGAVERALQIEPATRYTTAWSGNTMTITPAHHLAVNTPYTVVIARSTARNASGRAPDGDIRIAFGTTPGTIPTPAGPIPPPVIALQPIGSADPGASLLPAGDGSVVVTSSTVTAPAVTSATPSPTAAESSATPVPVAGRGETPATSAATPTGGRPAPSMVRLVPASGGAPVILGTAAGSAALSPNGNQLAFIVPASAGGAGGRLMVANANGEHPVKLSTTDSATGPIAWGGNDTIEFVADGHLQVADLLGNRHTLSPAAIGALQPVVLSAGGRAAFLGVAPGAGAGTSGDGILLDLASLSSRPLTGARDIAAFSADGGSVAWVDRSGPVPRVRAAATAGNSTPEIVADAGAAAGSPPVTTIALSPDGTRIAEGTDSSVVVRSVASGAELGEGSGGALSVAFAADGTHILVTRHGQGAGQVAIGAVPGSVAPASPAPADSVPSDAMSAVNAVVTAQLKHDAHALTGLFAADVATTGLLPEGISRGYVIRVAADPAGTMSANLRLIADGTDTTPPRAAAETLTLARSGGRFLVTAAHLDLLAAAPAGPAVIHVAQSTSGPVTTFDITFDSDLDPTTIPEAVSLATAGGATVDSTVRYDAGTRTVMVSSAAAHGGPLQVWISTALRDVAAQRLPAAYQTTTHG